MGTDKKYSFHLITEYKCEHYIQIKTNKMSSSLRQEYTQTSTASNNVKNMQKIYQSGPDPVHIKTLADKKMFRFLMPATYLSIAGTFGVFMYMALGKMKRAPQN